MLALARPVAGDGEVVVRVHAATVNPTDLMMRSGQQAAMMAGLQPPFIAGMEFSGEVHSVGAGVAALRPGQRVMGVVNPRRPDGGAHAQFVCVSAASAVALAPAVDLVEAATVPMNGLTSLAALQMLSLQPRQTLLVTGGAGVLAAYIIQLAKSAGVTVIADAAPSRINDLRALGADEVVPRGIEMDAAVRRLVPSGVDGLIDTALLGDRAAALVRDGGGAVSVRKTHPFTNSRVRGHQVSVVEHFGDTASLQRLAQLLADGKLKPRVGLRMPPSEAAQAHALTQQGGLGGRIVLDFSQ